MKKLILITLFSMLFSCKTSIPTTNQDVDNNTKPLVNYQKLKKNTIKKVFKLETDKHRLGKITSFNYSPSGNILKETTYKNENGKLIFEYETGYDYDHRDTLVNKYQYSEFHNDPQLIKYNYVHPSDSLSIIIETIGDHQIDSTFITTKKNALGKSIESSEISKRTYKKRDRIMHHYTTKSFYNNNNQLLKTITIDEQSRDTSKTDYTYLNNQILKSTYKRADYSNEKKYINGLLHTEEQTFYDGEKTLNKYSYNLQDQEILSQKIKKGKLVYSYKTEYNKNGLEVKYDMIDEEDGTSGIWLYEYDKKGQLKYYINLYARE